MTTYIDKVTSKFRRLSSYYDIFELAFLYQPSTSPRLAIARAIPDEPLEVLDVCCGNLAASAALANRKPLVKITGIDLSPDMLAVAERKVRKRGLGNVQLRRMDATAMTFDDGAFDVSMVSLGLHEMAYPMMMDVLREMARVTRAGGRLLIVDYEQQQALPKKLLLDIFLRLLEPAHLTEFLRYDWNRLLGEVGFGLDGMESCNWTKLLTATRLDRREGDTP